MECYKASFVLTAVAPLGHPDLRSQITCLFADVSGIRNPQCCCCPYLCIIVCIAKKRFLTSGPARNLNSKAIREWKMEKFYLYLSSRRQISSSITVT